MCIMADASLTDLAAFGQAEQEETLFCLYFVVSSPTLERIQCALSLVESIRHPFEGSITGNTRLMRAVDELRATKKSVSLLVSVEPESTKFGGGNHETSAVMRSNTGCRCQVPQAILHDFPEKTSHLSGFDDSQAIFYRFLFSNELWRQFRRFLAALTKVCGLLSASYPNQPEITALCADGLACVESIDADFRVPECAVLESQAPLNEPPNAVLIVGLDDTGTTQGGAIRRH